MTLLDIILEPNFPDTFRSAPKPVVPDTVIPTAPKPVVPDTVIPTDTTDTVATISNVIDGNLQIADVAPLPSGILGMAGDHLLWTVIVVLVALSLCFYFVRKYRKTNC
jgi:hypothetical protein